ncbi:MAG: hypothetical protein ACPHHT_03875 [Ilumatobacteraceae bacterium]
MQPGTESRRRLRPPRASYGSGDVPRWRWQHKVRMRWKGWQRWTTLGSPNFSPSSLERGDKRKAPCEIDGCEAPSVMKSGLCWSHRQSSPIS